MESFNYEVVLPDGKSKTGTIEAQNLEAAKAKLSSNGNLIVNIAQANALNKDLDIHIGKAVKARELGVFCRQFESILNAGVPVITALDMLSNQTENKTFKNTIKNVSGEVQRGETLADAMSHYPKIFPEIMIHMIAAGEASGSMDTTLDRLAGHFEKDAHLRGMIMKSMIYPIILILVIIVVVAIMMIKIVPTFTSSFDELGGGELPGITKFVMSVSDFFVDYWYIMLLIIAGVAVAFTAFKKTDTGAMIVGRIALKLPLVGTLSVKTASARLARTLSTLMASGIQMVDAVAIVRKIMTNEVVKRALKKAEEDVTHGLPLSKPLTESGVFPPVVCHMIEIGEQTGNIEDMLDKIADYYDDEVEMATEALMSALEPIIIIIMAVVVVPIILAIMLPIYCMYDSIG